MCAREAQRADAAEWRRCCECELTHILYCLQVRTFIFPEGGWQAKPEPQDQLTPQFPVQ
jgi:hypothetical protein